MLPPGHLAFSYLAVRPVLRRHLTSIEFAVLTAGTLFPAVSNVILSEIGLFGLNNKWSHSPLMLGSLGLVCFLTYVKSVPCRNVFLLFVLGVASHLTADYLFDFPLLYFSSGTDDVGGWWLFPIARIAVTGPQLSPGFDILPWYLLIEMAVLFWSVWLWKRWDLPVYAVVIFLLTLVALDKGL